MGTLNLISFSTITILDTDHLLLNCFSKSKVKILLLHLIFMTFWKKKKKTNQQLFSILSYTPNPSPNEHTRQLDSQSFTQKKKSLRNYNGLQEKDANSQRIFYLAIIPKLLLHKWEGFVERWGISSSYYFKKINFLPQQFLLKGASVFPATLVPILHLSNHLLNCMHPSSSPAPTISLDCHCPTSGPNYLYLEECNSFIGISASDFLSYP